MTINRRQLLVAGGIAAVLAVAVFVLWAANRKAAFARAAPAWLNPQQPPDGVASEINTLTADQSWAANRARHMSACCSPHSAGSRIRRTYASTLADSDGSFVRGKISLQIG